jgi:hypothetical protein
MTAGDFFRTALSGRDNESVDIGRVLWAGSAVLFGVLEVHSVIWLHQPFDALVFAQAVGLILVGGGASLGAKAHSEPEHRDEHGDK